MLRVNNIKKIPNEMGNGIAGHIHIRVQKQKGGLPD
jgi:hypothetical protein